MKRYVSVWFRFLKADWYVLREPALRDIPFVLGRTEQGRGVVVAANEVAQLQGIDAGMTIADARALLPGIKVLEDPLELENRLLQRIAVWAIRFTPITAVDTPDGIVLDATGCTHLWGGDHPYLKEIYQRFSSKGYNVRLAMADTPGAARSVARFAASAGVVESGRHIQAMYSLPPEALRLEPEVTEKLHKLGLHTIGQCIRMPLPVLRRRLGADAIKRLNQALGIEEELLKPVVPPVEYEERLPCPELITTATGIEIALKDLLRRLCSRLQKEQKGLRALCFRGYRADGETVELAIQTNRPSHHAAHLFSLFMPRLATIAPEPGIELFSLMATGVGINVAAQAALWNGDAGLVDLQVSELIDRAAGRIGRNRIFRYCPMENHWPELSFGKASSFEEMVMGNWRNDVQRPILMLTPPEPITVTAPVPDYPPMSFRYKGTLHTIQRADGPERIEQQWWMQEGAHRDYYRVEDAEGKRYWIFRLGHYEEAGARQWFLHGFFA